MMHWATTYIGRPWGPPGSGLSCWEFVRHVQAERYGQPLPEAPDAALGAPGWRRVALTMGGHVPEACADGDILLLRGTALHAGIVVEADGRLGLLHADGAIEGTRAVGHVVWEPLERALAGYRRCELWRRHAG